MNGFEKRRKSIRDAILNAALELFKEFGYNKVSISEIANKASVSQVSIYNFFKSKENLKQELLRNLMQDHLLELMNILESSAHVKEKLQELLKTRVEFFKSFSSRFLLEASQGEDFVKKYINDEIYQKVNSRLIDLIQEGKTDGIIDNSISTQAIISYMQIIQYYFVNNPSAIVQFEKDQELGREILYLVFSAFIKK